MTSSWELVCRVLTSLWICQNQTEQLCRPIGRHLPDTPPRSWAAVEHRATRWLTSSGRPTTLAPHGDAVRGADTEHEGTGYDVLDHRTARASRAACAWAPRDAPHRAGSERVGRL